MGQEPDSLVRLDILRVVQLSKYGKYYYIT